MKKKITISDPTLRDGSHAMHHQLNQEQVALYAAAVNAAAVDVVEVGHGNGLGASSLQVGESLCDDLTLLRVARSHLTRAKLGIHFIPGFATIRKDLEHAFEVGVDLVRIASHCTEADITKRHIQYTREQGKEAYGVLMMSHMASAETLVEEAQKMESYGAQAVIVMDSAGAYLPRDVEERIERLTKHLRIPVGFHAHNNLGMAIANSVAAVEAGASIIDGTARGFGAGAGNAALEILVAVLHKMGYETGIDLFKVLDAVELAEKSFIQKIPYSNSMNIISSLAGVFSGFSSHVEKAAQQFGVDPRQLFFELGKRKVVAGQEDVVFEIAHYLKNS